MSLAAIRPLFRTRLKALNFKEHKDGFDITNIPSTLLDKSFHIATGSISGETANQLAHPFDYPVTIRVFKKGFKDMSSALDAADVIAESIFTDILAPALRLGTAIKNIEPVSYDPIEISDNNNNIIILELVFNCKLILCF